MEIFCIFICDYSFLSLYIVVKTHQTKYFKLMNFIICKVYLNKLLIFFLKIEFYSIICIGICFSCKPKIHPQRDHTGQVVERGVHMTLIIVATYKEGLRTLQPSRASEVLSFSKMCPWQKLIRPILSHNKNDCRVLGGYILIHMFIDTFHLIQSENHKHLPLSI